MNRSYGEIMDVITDIKKFFYYDESNAEKPLVRSVDRAYNAKKGSRVGNSYGNGYFFIQVRSRKIQLHRAIFAWHKGYLPEIVDHNNGDISDNRINNLRAATRSENNCNAKISKSNKSGIKGVSLSHGRWLAQIMKDRKRITVYYGKDLDEAEKAIKLVRDEIHKEFTNHG